MKYYAVFSHEDEYGLRDKFIGLFSSRDIAEKAIIEARNSPNGDYYREMLIEEIELDCLTLPYYDTNENDRRNYWVKKVIKDFRG